MTKQKAIKINCFECAGDSNKEVTLCTAFDCPLWEYRTGNHITSRIYKERMATALKNYGKELLAEDMDRFRASLGSPSSKTRSYAKKSAGEGRGKGARP
jgi:hypothetical protein